MRDVIRVYALFLACIVGLTAGGAGITACAARQRAAAKQAVITCAKADALPIGVLLATWGIDAALSHHVNWQAIEADAWKHGATIGGCAVDRFVSALESRHAASVLPMDGTGAAVRERLRERWGGVEWQAAQ